MFTSGVPEHNHRLWGIARESYVHNIPTQCAYINIHDMRTPTPIPHARTYTHNHACMYTYTYHACIQPRWLHPHTYTQPTNSCTYIHIYVYTYSHIHVHPFTPCTCAYIHTCSIPTYAYNIRTHTCMHTHKYIHICIHAFESSAVTRPIFPGSALCRL